MANKKPRSREDFLQLLRKEIIVYINLATDDASLDIDELRC
jgi:hypothetical protein